MKPSIWKYLLVLLFPAFIMAGCASLEQAKNLNEQIDYYDATLDGIISSTASQYKAGVMSKETKDSIVKTVEKAMAAIDQARTLQSLQNPEDAAKALTDAQIIILQLQKQVGVTK